MRHNLKVIATMLLLAVTLAAWADGLNIVPQPLRVSRCDGEFVISAKTRIVCQPQLRQEAEWLADALRASTGLPLTVGSGGAVWLRSMPCSTSRAATTACQSQWYRP